MTPPEPAISDPAAASLTIALAATAGLLGQSVALRVSVPGIIVLLVVGVALGPDGVGLIAPKSLGAALPQLVNFAVAVILFEGGMHLKLQSFRDRSTAIRRLITWGALLSLAGGTITALLALDWDFRTSALFGALVIVTGPTVVTPLVRRFRLVRSVRTILEAEGVLIDAVGAVIAVVALEIALEPTGIKLATAILSVAARLGFGVVIGAAGGLLLNVLLKSRVAVAEGLINVFTLAFIWALFHTSEAVIHESGIAAVTVAGLVLGNAKVARERELLRFKDQLTVMMIGMLFVLLAANVSLQDVRALGLPGVLAVLALVLVVRPLTVFLCTRNCGLSWKEQLFVSWIGPRGIIAAAVASLFATRLDAAGIAGGRQLAAMIFLVIAITVTLAGLTGGILARMLRLTAQPSGWVVLGANEVAIELSKLLARAGDVVCIDSAKRACDSAQKSQVNALHGNGLDEALLEQTRIHTRAGAVALTPNDDVNVRFLQHVKTLNRSMSRGTALLSPSRNTEALEHSGAHLLFASSVDLKFWTRLLRQGEATLLSFHNTTGGKWQSEGTSTLYLPLALERDDSVHPMTTKESPSKGDTMHAVVHTAHKADALTVLLEHGWVLPGAQDAAPGIDSEQPA